MNMVHIPPASPPLSIVFRYPPSRGSPLDRALHFNLESSRGLLFISPVAKYIHPMNLCFIISVTLPVLHTAFLTKEEPIDPTTLSLDHDDETHSFTFARLSWSFTSLPSTPNLTKKCHFFSIENRKSTREPCIQFVKMPVEPPVIPAVGKPAFITPLDHDSVGYMEAI